jgi:hypothetical protein
MPQTLLAHKINLKIGGASMHIEGRSGKILKNGPVGARA